MKSKLPPVSTFHIPYLISRNAGHVKALKVTLQIDEVDYLSEIAPAELELADHPHYKVLQDYVRSNPRGAGSKPRADR